MALITVIQDRFDLKIDLKIDLKYFCLKLLPKEVENVCFVAIGNYQVWFNDKTLSF